MTDELIPQMTEQDKLKAEYFELAKQAGEKQYLIEVYKAELVQMNQKMLELNNKSHKLMAQNEQLAKPVEAEVVQ